MAVKRKGGRRGVRLLPRQAASKSAGRAPTRTVRVRRPAFGVQPVGPIIEQRSRGQGRNEPRRGGFGQVSGRTLLHDVRRGTDQLRAGCARRRAPTWSGANCRPAPRRSRSAGHEPLRVTHHLFRCVEAFRAAWHSSLAERPRREVRIFLARHRGGHKRSLSGRGRRVRHTHLSEGSRHVSADDCACASVLQASLQP